MSLACVAGALAGAAASAAASRSARSGSGFALLVVAVASYLLVSVAFLGGPPA